ncbi:hypothetical protein QVD17_31314 [Tagetes erecta]|uniref:Uncharacterized protein n=1 Tax=Tagetes erecta TaxID=13708 RepID=A0AAD8NP31_TARER|nr:hypothetical protein QVD17_31314 [Tagetes erecta]
MASTMATGFSSDDDELATLTHHFSRSVSLHKPPITFKEKNVFTGFSRSPATSFVNTDEEAWNMIYAVARMKVKMNNNSNGAGERCENGVKLLRQQQFCRTGGVCAWCPTDVQNRRFQQRPVNRKHGFDDGGYTAVKRECAGTGVFLPRRYSPEPQIRQASITQSSTKYSVPINGGFVSHNGYSTPSLVAKVEHKRPRDDINGVGMEAAANNPAVLLPQEWTY